MRGENTWYVYALATPGLPPVFRVFGRALRSLPLGRGIVAIVQRRTATPDPTIEALQKQHDILGRLAARVPGLLPARFGSLVDERELRKVVSDRRAEILAGLALVRGRCQMSVRVFGDSAPARSPAGAPSTGTAFLMSRRTRVHRTRAEVRRIREAVGALAAAERVEPGNRGLRVTVYHLISKQHVRLYEHRARTLKIRPYRTMVSGPWPPYAFAPELL